MAEKSAIAAALCASVSQILEHSFWFRDGLQNDFFLESHCVASNREREGEETRFFIIYVQFFSFRLFTKL